MWKCSNRYIDEQLKIKEHINHLSRIKNARTCLGDRNPIGFRDSFLKQARKNKAKIERSYQIQKDNQLLMKRIEAINKRTNRTLLDYRVRSAAPKREGTHAKKRKFDNIKRVKDNQFFVNKLLSVEPVISSKKLNNEYRKHKYLVNQMRQNSNRFYQNKFFYEDFETVLSPDCWDSKVDIESVYLNGSPARESLHSSIVSNTQNDQSDLNDYCQENKRVSRRNRTAMFAYAKNNQIKVRLRSSAKLTKKSSTTKLRKKNGPGHTNLLERQLKKRKRPFSAVNQKAHNVAQRIMNETEELIDQTSIGNIHVEDQKIKKRSLSDYSGAKKKARKVMTNI